MLYHLILTFVLAGFLPLGAQTLSWLGHSPEGLSLNRDLIADRSSKIVPNVVVFTGDRVIPQFVDGDGWKTTVTLVNLDSKTVRFDVLFFKDDGTDLYVPVLGQGSVRGVQVTLPTTQTITFETTGSSATLSQGWALLSKDGNDSVGGLTVFRQRVAGRPDIEAVVPIVNQFDGHFVLLYDNTEFVTAAAVTNPSLQRVVVPVTVRDDKGNILERRTLTLGPYEHTAFILADILKSTAGKRGSLEFVASGFGVGALGLRFNGSGGFTSFHVLSNFNWIVQ